MNRIGERLREASAPVPAGAWENIRSRISTEGPSLNAPSSGFPFGISAVAGLVLLGSLAWFGNYQPEHREVIAASQSIPVEDRVRNDETSTVIIVEDVETSETNSEPPIAESEPTPEKISADPKQNELPEGTAVPQSIASGEQESEPRQDILPIDISQPVPLSERAEPEEHAFSEPADEKTPPTTESISVEELQADIKPVQNTGYAPYTVQLEATGNAALYQWDLGRSGIVEGASKQVTFEEPGTYTIYLTGISQSGETKSEYVTFTVKEGSHLSVPDTFTPNGDGLNDEYRVKGSKIGDFQLSIIDSKGNVVFSTRNMNESWNFVEGNYNLDGEIYRVLVRATGVDGKNYSVNKRLTIIR